MGYKHNMENIERIYQMLLSYIEHHPFFKLSESEIEKAKSDPMIERLIKSLALNYAYLEIERQSQVKAIYPQLQKILIPELIPFYPSVAILAFDYQSLNGETVYISRNDHILFGRNSKPCYFTALFETVIIPAEAEVKKNLLSQNVIDIELKISDKSNFKFDLKHLSFYIDKQGKAREKIFYFLHEYLKDITLEILPTKKCLHLNREALKCIGFDSYDFFLKEHYFSNIELLYHYFHFNEIFYYFILDIEKFIDFFCDPIESVFIHLNFEIPLNFELTGRDFLVNTVPVINLFEHPLDPFKITHQKLKYPLITRFYNLTTKIFGVKSLDLVSKNKVIKCTKIFDPKSSEKIYFDLTPTEHVNCDYEVEFYWKNYHFNENLIACPYAWISNGDIPYLISQNDPESGFSLPISQTKKIYSINVIKNITPSYANSFLFSQEEIVHQLYSLNHQVLFEENQLKAFLSFLVQLSFFYNNAQLEPFLKMIQSLQLNFQHRPIKNHLSISEQPGFEIKIFAVDEFQDQFNLYLFTRILEKILSQYVPFHHYITVKLEQS